MDGIVLGLVHLAVITAVLVACLGGLFSWPRVLRLGRRILRATGLQDAPAERPSRPSLEQVAADVRRIRADVRRLPPGTPVARRRGILAAYDDALDDAAQLLGVSVASADARDPFAVEQRRLCLEQSLVDAGLVLEAHPRPAA